MADIYLTKIERKTIFTKSLIYVLVLFLIADLTVTGPFYFNFIPWLFLFSCFISLKGVDKVLTGIIGTFTVFVASLVTNGMTADTMLVTANAILQIVLGMLTSKGIFQFILEHRLVKYLGVRAKIILATILIAFFAVACTTLGFMEGDIITYSKAKANLEQYIEKTYTNQKYRIKNVTFNRKYEGKYAFNVKMDGEVLCFIPNTNGTFNDINEEERLNKSNKDIEEKTRDYIKKTVKGMKYLTSDNIKFKYEYTKVSLKPDCLVLNVTLEAKDKTLTYSEISKAVNELIKLEYDVSKVVISLNNASLYITKDKLGLITPKYIKGGFDIENLDD